MRRAPVGLRCRPLPWAGLCLLLVQALVSGLVSRPAHGGEWHNAEAICGLAERAVAYQQAKNAALAILNAPVRPGFVERLDDQGKRVFSATIKTFSLWMIAGCRPLYVIRTYGPGHGNKSVESGLHNAASGFRQKGSWGGICASEAIAQGTAAILPGGRYFALRPNKPDMEIAVFEVDSNQYNMCTFTGERWTFECEKGCL